MQFKTFFLNDLQVAPVGIFTAAMFSVGCDGTVGRVLRDESLPTRRVRCCVTRSVSAVTWNDRPEPGWTKLRPL